MPSLWRRAMWLKQREGEREEARSRGRGGGEGRVFRAFVDHGGGTLAFVLSEVSGNHGGF